MRTEGDILCTLLSGIVSKTYGVTNEEINVSDIDICRGRNVRPTWIPEQQKGHTSRQPCKRPSFPLSPVFPLFTR